MHILSHYKGHSFSALCKYLKTFLSKHIKWVASVGHDVLSKKHLAVEDYANDLSEGQIPVDPLGLLCITRIWHIHFGVFLKNQIWTTRCDNTLMNVTVFLMFTGGFTYFDTCIQQSFHPTILSPEGSENENSTLELETELMNIDDESSIYASIVSTKATLLGSLGAPGTKDTSFSGIKDSSFSSVDSGTKSASSSRGTKGSACGHKHKCKRSSSAGPRPKKRHALRPRNNNKTANKIHSKAIVQSCRATRSRHPLLEYTLDDLLSNNKKHGAKPNTLKEEDPILKAFQENQPEELPELLKADSEDKKKNKKSSLVSSDEVKTEAGKVKVNQYALKRRKKIPKTFHCSSDGCDTTEATRKAMNIHEKENHLDISYTCSVCTATNFSSYESVFKHEKHHYKFIYPYDVCGKLFQFPSQVNKHEAVHYPKKGFICTW